MTDRRSFLRMAFMGTAGILVAGCDRISQSGWGTRVLGSAEGLNRRVQALLAPRARKLGGGIAGRALYDGNLNATAALQLIVQHRAALAGGSS